MYIILFMQLILVMCVDMSPDISLGAYQNGYGGSNGYISGTDGLFVQRSDDSYQREGWKDPRRKRQKYLQHLWSRLFQSNFLRGLQLVIRDLNLTKHRLHGVRNVINTSVLLSGLLQCLLWLHW